MNAIDLVKEFRRVRDIPFRIPLGPDEPDHCCAGKSTQLQAIYENAGYDVRVRVCTFCWDDLPLPGSVRILQHDPQCTHEYLEIKIARRWRIIDPTWDAGLAGVLPVFEWDGQSNTGVAVTIKSIYSLKRSLKIIEADRQKENQMADLQRNGEFYRALNGWLQRIRK